MSGLEKSNNNTKLERELKSLPDLDEFARDSLLGLDPLTQSLILKSNNLNDFKAAIYNREPDMALQNNFAKKYWAVERYFIEKDRESIKDVMDKTA